MTTDDIRQRLFELQDIPYRDFQAKLIPTVDPDTVIGVRTPALRQLAKELGWTAAQKGKSPVSNSSTCFAEPAVMDFLRELPHRYFDENQLHSFLLSGIRDFDLCIAETERFLPFIDNWATCDQLSPKVFRKHRTELLTHIQRWIASGEAGISQTGNASGETCIGRIVNASDRTYMIRFGIGMLMQHFLDDAFTPEYPALVAGIRSEEYYINMMIAWYFATALAKQYDAVLPYLTEHRLDPWTHNKTIQKAVESFRITPEQKAYLKTLRISVPRRHL